MASSQPRRYFVSTFGCRVNQADSAGLAGELERGGLVRAGRPEDAQVVVLNTCTVTHRSDADVRKAVARLQREAPDARVMVTGCFAQRDPEAARAIPGVSAVVGNAHKSRLPVLAEQIAGGLDEPLVVHSEMEAMPKDALPVEPVTTVLDRTRPFVKIQDGCDAHCSYCIIPAVRGPARGADPVRVRAAVETLVARGYFEVVLTGIHLGTYAYEDAAGRQTDLSGLVEDLLEVPGLGRLRLSCIEPMAFPMALPRLARGDRRLAPHFHLPLQSGSDRILKRMVRPYRARDFGALLDGIRAELPEACLGTDVIVGFPGETDEDFEETFRFVERSGLHYVHVFSYSHRSGVAPEGAPQRSARRRGTPATRLDGAVDPRVVKARATRLNTLGKSLFARYLDHQFGRTLPALVLEPDPRRAGYARALTGNFCNVDIETPLPAGTPVDVSIVGREGQRLVGRLDGRAQSVETESAGRSSLGSLEERGTMVSPADSRRARSARTSRR